MVLDQEWQQKPVGNFCQEEELKVEKDFQLKKIMTKLESLKKNSHFQMILKNRVISNDYFTIYRKKNFIKKKEKIKCLYVSFVMKKKVGTAVKRNKIKRKLKSIIQQLLKINSFISLDYAYVIFGKEKAYKENQNSLFEKMKKSFKIINDL